MSVTGNNAKHLFVLSSIASPYNCNTIYLINTTTTWLQPANYPIQQLPIHPCLLTRVPSYRPQPHSHSCDVPIVYATNAMAPANTHQHSCYVDLRNCLPNDSKYYQSKVMRGLRRKCPCLCMCVCMSIVSPMQLNEKYNDQRLNLFPIEAKMKVCRCNQNNNNAHGRKFHGHKT